MGRWPPHMHAWNVTGKNLVVPEHRASVRKLPKIRPLRVFDGEPNALLDADVSYSVAESGQGGGFGDFEVVEV